MNAFQIAASLCWAIQEEYLQTILECAARVDADPDRDKRIEAALLAKEEREATPAAVATRAGDRIDGTFKVRMRADAPGVAIIPVIGPIFRYANLFTMFSGGTSTDLLARDIQASLDNPNVKAILLNIDSPGGEAFGINELANIITKGATKKPIVAYISGAGASGAYWLASAADEIVIDDLANLGSIGVVMAVPDSQKHNAERGIHEFVSSQSPHKRPKPGTEIGDSKYQERVDDMAAVFISAVAANRGVSEETVMNDFGGGGVLVGKKAVDVKLADRIGSFEATLMEMAAGKGKRKKKAMYAGASAETDNNLPESGDIKGEKTMNLWDQLKAALSGEAPAAAAPPAQQAPIVIQAATPATQTAPAGESEEVKKLKAENAELKKAKLTAEAESFINAKIVAREVLPSVKDAFIRDYVRAAMDDEANPVAQGEPSRVDALKSHYDGKPKHKLSMELVKSDVKGAIILDNDEDPEAAELAATQESARTYALKANGKKAS